MVQLICSPRVREKLERELAIYEIPLESDGQWVLVERGLAIPPDKPTIVFDGFDYMEVVRMLVAGLRVDRLRARTVVGQSGNALTMIAARDVRYFEATMDGTVADTAAGRHRVRETLQYFETSWIGFVRINRSQLVNLSHLKEIVPWFNSRYVLRLNGGSELEVSKTYAKRLRGALKI